MGSFELESAESCEERKISPSAQFSVRAILSRVYVQLDARPIEKDCREIVYSWKNSELESAEQREKVRNLALSPIQYSRDSQSNFFN